MRVVGYVRESADPEDPRPAFAQYEEIRRWTTERGHHLVGICQDTRQAGHALGRDGYLALLGTIEAGGVDAVVVPGVETFSSDQIVQEIMLGDLRSRRVRVLSTRPDEAAVMGGTDADPARMLIRDVLARVAEHDRSITGRRIERPVGPVDVVIEPDSAGSETGSQDDPAAGPPPEGTAAAD